MAAYRLHPIRRARPVDATDDDTFLVPADNAPFSPPGAVRRLTAAELVAAQLPPTTLPQILYTAAVLVTQRNCPVDVVNSILEFAGLFLSFHNATHEHVYGRDNMNQEYLRLDLPASQDLALPEGVTVSKCMFAAVECTSKDQGWASEDQALNGTYQSSCTWLEVAVLKPAAASLADVHVSIAEQTAAERTNEDTERSTSDKMTREDFGNDGDDDDHTSEPAVADDNMVEVARVVALYNVRAHRAFRHHLKCYEDPAGLVGRIELGDSLRLVLRSQYPGWANSAKFGSVSAFFALEFDEEFSFADVPFPAAAAEDEGELGDSLAGDGGFACCLQ